MTIVLILKGEALNMGTDIHAAIEYRAQGEWHALMLPNKYYKKWDDEPEMTARVDLNRDYDMFAILAGVRNGTGFAGCLTGEGFVPIVDASNDDFEPLPDMSAEAKQVMSREHSFACITLQDLLEYDWTRMATHYGVVSAKTFERWDRMKEWNPVPDEWCGGVTGPGIEMVDEVRMRQYIKEVVGNKRGVEFEEAIEKLDDYKAKFKPYCRISWKTTYAQSGAQIWEKILPLMLKLAKEHGRENVRMVMDFDS